MKEQIIIPKSAVLQMINFAEMQIEKAKMFKRFLSKIGIEGNLPGMAIDLEVAVSKALIDELNSYLNGCPMDDPEKFCNGKECETCRFEAICKKYKTTT